MAMVVDLLDPGVPIAIGAGQALQNVKHILHDSFIAL